jgi:hypothetical protein
MPYDGLGTSAVTDSTKLVIVIHAAGGSDSAESEVSSNRLHYWTDRKSDALLE